MSTPLSETPESHDAQDVGVYALDVDSAPFSHPRHMHRAMKEVLHRLNTLGPDTVEVFLQRYDGTIYDWITLNVIHSFADPRIALGISSHHRAMKTIIADTKNTDVPIVHPELFRIHAIAHG